MVIQAATNALEQSEKETENEIIIAESTITQAIEIMDVLYEVKLKILGKETAERNDSNKEVVS